MTHDDLIEKYAKALTEVEALGDAFEEVMQEHDKDFSKGYFCWMFESLLQYSLLELSVADGIIDPKEILLANQVTKYADVITLGNALLKTNVKWEDLLEADADAMKKWLDSFKVAFMPMRDTFISQFAAFDTIAPGNSLGKLIEGVSAILTIFVTVDDRVYEDEKRAVQQTLICRTLLDIGKTMSN